MVLKLARMDPFVSNLAREPKRVAHPCLRPLGVHGPPVKKQWIACCKNFKKEFPVQVLMQTIDISLKLVYV